MRYFSNVERQVIYRVELFSAGSQKRRMACHPSNLILGIAGHTSSENLQPYAKLHLAMASSDRMEMCQIVVAPKLAYNRSILSQSRSPIHTSLSRDDSLKLRSS